MNYPIVFKMLSMVFGTLSIAVGACAGFCAYFGNSILEQEALPNWITCFAVCILVSVIFYIPGKSAQMKLFKREAMCVIGLSWLFTSFFGALPFVLILNANFADAFFESASGFTTTGSSVFASVENFPRSLVLWRALSQWIGGLGVVVLFVAILSFLGASARILYSYESSAKSYEHDSGQIRNGVFRIFAVYLFLSASCAVCYKLCGLDYFDAFCHMLTTVSSGGFGTFEQNVGAFNNSALEWAMIFFMFVSGVSFIYILSLLRGNVEYIKRNTEFYAYVAILAFSTFIVFVSRENYASFSGALANFRTSAFQCVSIMTSTGYAVCDYQTWKPITHVLFFVLIFIGGCSGSTSGGLKVARVVAAVKLAVAHLARSYRPRLVNPVKLNGRVLAESGSVEILTFIVLYVLAFFAGTLVISILEPETSFEGAMSAVIASLSNAGPGFGEFGPFANYSPLSAASKLALAFVMILGRIELYAILALFAPSFWKTFR